VTPRRAALALALGLLGAQLAAAEPVRIRGTRVWLEAPPGFAASPDFPGIGRDEDLSSVLVTELPLPLERARASFTREALAERGVELHRSVEVDVDGRRGSLLHATQRAAGTTFRKWLLLFGEGGASVLVTATTPLDLESVHGEALVTVLRRARWEPASEVAGDRGLRFQVRGSAPFEVVTTAPNAVVLADPDHDGTGGEVPPLIAVGSSLGRVHIADLPEFSRRRLLETATLDEIEVRAPGRPRDRGRRPGHRDAASRAGDAHPRRRRRALLPDAGDLRRGPTRGVRRGLRAGGRQLRAGRRGVSRPRHPGSRGAFAGSLARPARDRVRWPSPCPQPSQG
jgi:hypothetical protein